MKTQRVSTPRRNTRRATYTESKRPSVLASLDWGRVRLWVVGFFFTFLWVALWGRAYYLQVVKGPELAERARRQHQTTETVVGVRGDIMDRHGNVLARSVDSSSISLNPQLIVDRPMTASVLGKILEVPSSTILALMEKHKSFVWVVRKANNSVGKQVQAAGLPGVFVTSEFERVYPYKTLAGQLLGFVNTDEKGIEGLEKSYEERLGAQRVRQVVERDAARRRLGGQEGNLSDLRGEDVRLTIDTQVQFFAEEALAANVEKFGASWGGCIVVDVPTGEILAWAQYPFFDPNAYQKFSEKIRRNRLATDALEQGSTIKSFLIAAALEEKVVAPTTPINCEKGKWKIGTSMIHDTHAYATLPVDKILHVSSNIGAAKIGMRLGASKYASYLRRLGFGEPANLPLAGQSKGILRPASQWQEIDLAATSFGQSFSATLVQMARAYLCLASDGAQKDLVLELPVDEVMEVEGDVPQAVPVAEPAPEKLFSPETMRQVRAMLREVVEEEGGTGKEARIPGMVVGGKTGTAQKADRSGKYGSGRVGSFVGMVPIDNPRYLVCVLLDEPTKNQYGGVVAAPVFRHVALHTMAYHGLLPDTDDPLVKAIAEKEAARKVQGRKKTPQSSTGAAQASGQTAAGAATATASGTPQGTRAPKREKAAAAKRSALVPRVVGMGVKDALAIFAANGFVPSFQGAGTVVVRQTPEAGAAWPAAKTQCTLWLEDVQL